ncbi:choline kinase family protein [Chromobacterium sp. IIBBL 290-4]|uniref:choline kinase family protein n=1 Tax=Chromobacterium sp. IIBBL 290-4 TaxID=2953890 RepID=UPI0020B8D2E0|nr:choline kinase family protein [Chromobacterium sp. IIBBL 290-4]UTH76403.1 choline kinase family protein [Chromobacterium sp. IIBBL 290-4]
MAFPIPEAISAAIRQAFPEGAGIVPQALAPGLSGARIFRFEAGGQSFVIRQSAHIERAERETQCWRGAAALGVAPRLVYADAASGITISEFIAAEGMDRSPAGIHRVASALRRLHQSRAFDGGMPLAEILAGEVAKLGMGQPDAVIQAICQAAAEADAISREGERAPCHFDLNPGNILLSGERVLFLDWETAGLGDPYIDLAQLGVFVFPTPEQGQSLLRAYLQTEPTPAEQGRLAAGRVIALAFYALGFFLAARRRDAALRLAAVSPVSWGDLFALLSSGGAQSAPEVAAATLAAEMRRCQQSEAYRQALARRTALGV